MGGHGTLFRGATILTMNVTSDVFVGDLLVEDDLIAAMVRQLDVADAALVDALGAI